MRKMIYNIKLDSWDKNNAFLVGLKMVFWHSAGKLMYPW